MQHPLIFKNNSCSAKEYPVHPQPQSLFSRSSQSTRWSTMSSFHAQVPSDACLFTKLIPSLHARRDTVRLICVSMNQRDTNQSDLWMSDSMTGHCAFGTGKHRTMFPYWWWLGVQLQFKCFTLYLRFNINSIISSANIPRSTFPRWWTAICYFLLSTRICEIMTTNAICVHWAFQMSSV